MKGSEGASKARKERIVKYRQRLKRFRRLRLEGGRMAQVLAAGLHASVCYGQEVTGLPPKLRRKMRAEAARAHQMGAPGADPGLMWAHEEYSDPAMMAELAPTKRFLEEWWMATDQGLRPIDCLKPSELTDAMENERGKSYTYQSASGSPVRLAIIGFEAAGWKIENAACFFDLRGERFTATIDGPAEGFRRLKRDYKQKQANDKVHAEMMDTKEAALFEAGGLWLSPARGLLRRTSRRLNANEKVALRRFVTSTTPTRCELRRRGYEIDEKCRRCNRVDDVWHRLYAPDCPRCTAARDEAEAWIPKGLRKKAIEAGRHDPFYTKGWTARPALLDRSPPEEMQIHYYARTKQAPDPDPEDMDYDPWADEDDTAPGVLEEVPHIEFDERLSVYLDGSCQRPMFEGLARAGASALQIDDKGKVTKVAIAAIPKTMRQTAATGENVAAVIGINLARKGFKGAGDCTGVIGAVKRGPVYARGMRRPQAALWREAAPIFGRGTIEIRHVTAHRCVAEAESNEEELDILGNAEADTWAKKASQLYTPTQHDIDVVEGKWTESHAILYYAARVLAKWLRLREEHPDLKRRKTEASSGEDAAEVATEETSAQGEIQVERKQGDHDWIPRGDLYLCRYCLRKVKNREGRAATRYCEGRPHYWDKAIWLGHCLQVSIDNNGMMMASCSKCGGFGTERPQKLLQECHGGKTEYGERCAKDMEVQRHPTTKETFTKTVKAWESLASERGERASKDRPSDLWLPKPEEPAKTSRPSSHGWWQ